jgi:hypothetical protein
MAGGVRGKYRVPSSRGQVAVRRRRLGRLLC